MAEKKMTLKEFDAGWRIRGHGPVSVFNEQLIALKELQPVAITGGEGDTAERRRTFSRLARRRLGLKRVRTMIANGTVYACLMPEAD